MKKKLINLSILIAISFLILPACNKPQKTKGADNAVTQYHKKQMNKIKQAEVTVKKLNIDIKKGENRAKEIKSE